MKHKHTGARVLPAVADPGNEQGCDRMVEQFPEALRADGGWVRSVF
ncbi:hypothetical protein [Paenibacillus riograndensis]|nr:hypothetical protein [Paenibacillus riograndensis]